MKKSKRFTEFVRQVEQCQNGCNDYWKTWGKHILELQAQGIEDISSSYEEHIDPETGTKIRVFQRRKFEVLKIN